jgi:hypothetical protein
MSTEYSIIILAGAAVGIVLLSAHPRSGSVFAAVRQRVRASLPPGIQFTWRRFWIGVALTACAFAALNFLPYLITRHEPEHHGSQVMGFPFTFRSYGGYSPSVHFETQALFIDAATGLFLAAIMGYAVAKFRWKSA